MNIDRRQWLAAVVAAGVVTRSVRLQGAEGLEPFRFIVVTDTHLGRGDSTTPERQWQQALREIETAPGDFILHLGDIVDGGRPEWYPRYAELRQGIKRPIHEIPGNHDPPELFTQHVRPASDRSFDHSGVRFVLFNNARTDSHLGFITPEQLDWLGEELATAQARGLRVVIACHVPIHTNTNPDRAWHVKAADGQTAFYALLDRHPGLVLACLHGHFHNGLRGWRDRHATVEVLCPSVLYNQDRNLAEHLRAGRAGGFFIEELRPGFILATLGQGRLTLSYKPLGAEPHGEYQAQWPA